MFQSRKLNDLDIRMRVKVFEFLARLTEVKIPVLIVGTLRDQEQQKEYVKNKVSWTMNSLHLPQSPSNLALAIDIVPYSIYDAVGPDKLNWNETDPIWNLIGAIGVSLGLKWGVVVNGKRKDLGHFEYIKEKK